MAEDTRIQKVVNMLKEKLTITIFTYQNEKGQGCIVNIQELDETTLEINEKKYILKANQTSKGDTYYKGFKKELIDDPNYERVKDKVKAKSTGKTKPKV